MHAVDARIVGAKQVAAELKIIGRVGKDQIDGGTWDFLEYGEAIAMNNLIGQLGNTRN
jgi:hypothetical protein